MEEKGHHHQLTFQHERQFSESRDAFISHLSGIPGDEEYKVRVERTVSIRIAEARNLPKGISGTFVEVFVESRKESVHKTPTKYKEKNPFFGEELDITLLEDEVFLRIVLWKESSKKNMVKHTQLGQLLLDLNSVELGENWYPLETAKKSKHGQIDIRLTIIFRETAILPSDKYTKLLDMLLDLSSNFKIIMIIATSKRVKGKEMIEFSQLFTKIAEFRGIAPAMVTSLLLYDVQNAESVETLFRGNSMGTKALDFYMKLVASRWLDCLRPIVQNILATEFNCEAREGKLAPEDSLDSNLKNLENYFTLTIQAIFASVRECPISLRKICYHIRNAVQETYPDDPIVPYTAVTGFIFLRFFVPAIMTPKLFGLAGEFYTGTADRTFTLVASLVQKLANFSLFEPHEAHLDRINPVLEREQENLKKFLHVICDSPHPHDEKAISFKNAFDIDLEVARLCRQFSDDLNPLLDALPAKYIASFLGELDVVFEEMKFLLKKFKNQQTKNRLYTKSENPHEEIIVRSTRGKEKDEREKRDSEKKRRSFSLDRLKKSHKSSAPKLSQSDND